MFLLVVIVAGMFLLTVGSSLIAAGLTMAVVYPVFGARAYNWVVERFGAVALTLFAIYSLPFFLLYGYLLSESFPWRS